MKAFVVGRYGSKDGLQMREVPEPGIGEHDVLVRGAGGERQPRSTPRSGTASSSGSCPTGCPSCSVTTWQAVVVRVGSAVRSFAPGDEVYARPGTDTIGTFAELAAVHEDDLALKPATLTMEESAALPLVALTAWQALVERANLQPGQKVLVHAGSGGVGTIAIQLARHLGAHVATTTGTANTGWVKDLGADVVIDYKREDFEKVLRDYDVVLDSLGGQTLEKSLRVLRPGGIAIGIAGPPDPGFAREIGANPVVRLATVLLSAPDQAAGPATPRAVLVPVHEGQRRAAPRDRRPRRRRHDQAGHRPGLPLRVDQGRHGLRRERAGQGQGRRHDG